MHPPSLLYWLWTKVSCLLMVLSLCAFLLLGITGIGLFCLRRFKRPRPGWLRPLHHIIGWVMIDSVLLLFAIGLASSLGLHGSLGHSSHLFAGLAVVALVLLSAGSARLISSKRPWARTVHVSANIALLVAFIWVLLTGWAVLQNYSHLSLSSPLVGTSLVSPCWAGGAIAKSNFP